MYRITKVLNHNTILAVRVEDNQECMIMGKGVGFGKKITTAVRWSVNSLVLDTGARANDP